jgi:cysteine desulfurase
VRHYLDHASTSPLRPEARAALTAWLAHPAGDPSRLHAEGMAARVAVEDARTHVATLLGTRSRSVVFTSGATEAIVTAAWGAAERGTHAVVPAIEHSAVRKAAALFGDVTTVPCDGHGVVDPDDVMAAVQPGTALVHLQWGNHEVGTLQPVAEVVARCRQCGVLVHIDAAQGAGHGPIAFDALGADLMSVSAHKMGSLPGVGALLVRRGLRLRPLLVGGDEERARRAGLENVPAIAAWGAVAEALGKSVEEEAAHQHALMERVAALAAALDGVVRYGHPTDRLPHIVCLGIEGVEPQAVLLGLDQAGIAAHSGSACAAEDLQPSPVLQAMGVEAQRSLRISAGWNTTAADVDALADVLPRVLQRLRALRG